MESFLLERKGPNGEIRLGLFVFQAITMVPNCYYITENSIVEFCIGGYVHGYETRTYTIDADKVHTHIEHSLILEPSNIGDFGIEEMSKDYLECTVF